MTEIAFSAQHVSALAGERIRFRMENQDVVVPIYHEPIDKIFNPALPGELISVIGRPGNGKTSFMVRWAKERAAHLNRLREEGENQRREVFYITYEQAVEDLAVIVASSERNLDITRIARGTLDDDEYGDAMKGLVNLGLMPLHFIGHSDSNREQRPKLYVSAIVDAIEDVKKTHNRIPDCIFIDYLQRIPFEHRYESKVVGTMETLESLKDCALILGCPVIVGVQAKREVDDRRWQVPQMWDGQWTSNIEQASDKILTLVRPVQYKKQGETFKEITVEGHSQMMVTLAKQRLGIANKYWWIYFDPAFNKLSELELGNYKPHMDVDDPDDVIPGFEW